MIIEFTKIPNGLKWDNQERLFTTEHLPNGYQIERHDLAYIELDNQIFLLCSEDSTIDGNTFSGIQDEIDYIYQ
jgi:hypothetical protein